MKNINKLTLAFLVGSLLFTGCKKFDDMNVDPFAVSEDNVRVEYLINNSIGGAQMDPHIAERAFVLYWKTAGHQHLASGLSTGAYDEGWTGDYYNYISGWLNHINTAVQVAEKQIAENKGFYYTSNSLQVARIWRAYLMSELSDNFGPIGINAFQGVNPDMNSVQEVYTFLLRELKEASAAMDLSVTKPASPSTFSNLDPAYGYDYGKWQRYANSMRMRLAMRLSEVDAATAKTEFEDAAKGPFISNWDESFKVVERGGWDSYTAVMSREWNTQPLSATLYNIFFNLGGVTSNQQVADSMKKFIKPANYMGKRYLDHFTTMTNAPNAGYWFDGLPDVIDPRAYEMFPIPGEFSDSHFNFYPSWTNDARTLARDLMTTDDKTLLTINAKGHYNAHAAGDWGEKGARNRVRSYTGTLPRLGQQFRDSEGYRVWFGSWESYFLLAEAAVRGWNVGMSGQAAYEKGIDESFAYNGVSGFAAEYKASVTYNNNGTSVSWGHTAEPPASVSRDFVDGYTGTPGKVDFKFSKNDLYKNGSVKNDHLTKIITQKFIAQTPYLPLETWSDHRRLGLPFFENPAVEKPLTNLPALSASNYMTSNVKFFPQRIKYPSSLMTSNANGYDQALQFLGGPDAVLTPLWWAKKQ